MILGGETETFITAVKGSRVVDEFFSRTTHKKFPDDEPDDPFVQFYRQCIGPPLIPENLSFQIPSHIFLTNGARLYLDTGSHVEYATAEARSPRRAVIQEKAGDRIIEKAMERAKVIWGEEGWKLAFYKTNLERRGNVCGTHESYIIPPDVMITQLSELQFSFLEGFLISRLLYAANGYFRWEGSRLKFYKSQRAMKTEEPISGATTSNRGIISTRNEPLADINHFKRLHIIIGDALLFDAAMFLKFATTAKIVEYVFSGAQLNPPLGRVPNSKDFISALAKFNEGPELDTPFTFNEKSFTAADLQEEYYKIIKSFWEQERDMTPEDRLHFSLWESAVKKAKYPRPHEELRFFSDWAYKYTFIAEDWDRRGYSKPYDEVKRLRKGREITVEAQSHVEQLNTEFHAVYPKGIARRILEDPSSQVIKLVFPHEVDSAMYNPEPTRATARGKAIQWASEEASRLGRNLTLAFAPSNEWCGIEVIDKPSGTVTGPTMKIFVMVDPYDTELHEGTSLPPSPNGDIFGG